MTQVQRGLLPARHVCQICIENGWLGAFYTGRVYKAVHGHFHSKINNNPNKFVQPNVAPEDFIETLVMMDNTNYRWRAMVPCHKGAICLHSAIKHDHNRVPWHASGWLSRREPPKLAKPQQLRATTPWDKCTLKRNVKLD